jgi:hypothetical protein
MPDDIVLPLICVCCISVFCQQFCLLETEEQHINGVEMMWRPLAFYPHSIVNLKRVFSCVVCVPTACPYICLRWLRNCLKCH